MKNGNHGTSAVMERRPASQGVAKAGGEAAALTHAELRVLISALAALKQGDSSVRLPLDWTGLPGRLAETFNEVVDLNCHVADEPVVDRAQGRHHPAPDAGLFLNLADGGVLSALASLQMALGKGPQQPSPAVQPADDGRPRLAAGAVDDQPARGGLLDLAQAPPGAGTAGGGTGAGHSAMVATGSRSPPRPGRGPTGAEQSAPAPSGRTLASRAQGPCSRVAPPRPGAAHCGAGAADQ